MIDYKNRSLKKEILDQNDIPFEDIFLNMKELEFINSHLGGHSITIEGFKKLLQNRREISVCEIGCGGGDNLKAIESFCKKKRIISSFTGIDINKDCIAFARESTGLKNIKFIASDYKKIKFENEKPCIIFSSLFCHHFTENELIEILHWMKNNSETGFFINDLHRHPVAYHFIKMATKIFSKSYLVKNDAPLSVLRGFKKKEWNNIFQKAGIKNYSISWKWAFRYLIIVFNLQNH
ncbi:MAG: methyltransferase domain-containing protein [Ginsengibacter sp.]